MTAQDNIHAWIFFGGIMLAAIALVVYADIRNAIENRRYNQGPWYLVITRQSSDSLAIQYDSYDDARVAELSSDYIDGLVEEDCLELELTKEPLSNLKIVIPPVEKKETR